MTAEIRTVRDLYLWCMSVVYLFAFTSLFVQIPGNPTLERYLIDNTNMIYCEPVC